MDVLKVVKRHPMVFPLACVAAAAMVFISEGSYWQSVGTRSEMEATEAARVSIYALQRNILDAETGQRGFLLTSRKEYLLTYANALKKTGESFQLLEKRYDKESQPRDVLRKLHRMTEGKLSELALTIRLHDEGRSQAVTEIILSDIGKEQLATILALTDELLAYERLHAVSDQGDLFQTLILNRIGVAVLSAISLLALFMYLRQPFALERRQQEQRRLVQAERDQLEVEVKHRMAQLTELTLHLQTAREDERHRLARNLHDDLGALLTSAKLDAARIKSRLTGAPETLELLAHLVGALNSSIAMGRSIIEDLRPSALSNLGLVATLEILTNEFAEHSGVHVHCSLGLVELDAAAELMVYRLVQEAITNITKYAQAHHVWVSLATCEHQVEISIRDDGTGFDTKRPQSAAYGLVGMRFRVEAQGGTLAVVSAPGQGTLIQAKLPELRLVKSTTFMSR